jgi:hypothetical protein
MKPSLQTPVPPKIKMKKRKRILEELWGSLPLLGTLFSEP